MLWLYVLLNHFEPSILAYIIYLGYTICFNPLRSSKKLNNKKYQAGIYIAYFFSYKGHLN